jgi:hypothetical protein
VTVVDSSMNSLNGSVTIMTAMPSVSSRNRPDQNQVAPWKKRCRPGWSFSLSATTSEASWVTRGLRVGAVRANTTHIARFASGNCSSNIHRFPVLIATAVWTVRMSAEIMSSAEDDPVSALRIAMSSQTTPVPASSPASGLTRSVMTM